MHLCQLCRQDASCRADSLLECSLTLFKAQDRTGGPSMIESDKASVSDKRRNRRLRNERTFGRACTAMRVASYSARQRQSPRTSRNPPW